MLLPRRIYEGRLAAILAIINRGLSPVMLVYISFVNKELPSPMSMWGINTLPLMDVCFNAIFPTTVTIELVYGIFHFASMVILAHNYHQIDPSLNFHLPWRLLYSAVCTTFLVWIQFVRRRTAIARRLRRDIAATAALAAKASAPSDATGPSGSTPVGGRPASSTTTQLHATLVSQHQPGASRRISRVASAVAAAAVRYVSTGRRPRRHYSFLLKIDNAEPGQIREGYRERIEQVLAAARPPLELIDTYIRRGCIELVIDARAAITEDEDGDAYGSGPGGGGKMASEGAAAAGDGGRCSGEEEEGCPDVDIGALIRALMLDWDEEEQQVEVEVESGAGAVPGSNRAVSSAPLSAVGSVSSMTRSAPSSADALDDPSLSPLLSSVDCQLWGLPPASDTSSRPRIVSVHPRVLSVPRAAGAAGAVPPNPATQPSPRTNLVITASWPAASETWDGSPSFGAGTDLQRPSRLSAQLAQGSLSRDRAARSQAQGPLGSSMIRRGGTPDLPDVPSVPGPGAPGFLPPARELVLRSQGVYLPVSVGLQGEDGEAAAARAGQDVPDSVALHDVTPRLGFVYNVQVTGLPPRPGLLLAEARLDGRAASRAVPVLLVDDPWVAEELETVLGPAWNGSAEDLDAFVVDLGSFLNQAVTVVAAAAGTAPSAGLVVAAGGEVWAGRGGCRDRALQLVRLGQHLLGFLGSNGWERTAARLREELRALDLLLDSAFTGAKMAGADGALTARTAAAAAAAAATTATTATNGGPVGTNTNGGPVGTFSEVCGAGPEEQRPRAADSHDGSVRLDDDSIGVGGHGAVCPGLAGASGSKAGAGVVRAGPPCCLPPGTLEAVYGRRGGKGATWQVILTWLQVHMLLLELGVLALPPALHWSGLSHSAAASDVGALLLGCAGVLGGLIALPPAGGRPDRLLRQAAVPRSLLYLVARCAHVAAGVATPAVLLSYEMGPGLVLVEGVLRPALLRVAPLAAVHLEAVKVPLYVLVWRRVMPAGPGPWWWAARAAAVSALSVCTSLACGQLRGGLAPREAAVVCSSAVHR